MPQSATAPVQSTALGLKEIERLGRDFSRDGEWPCIIVSYEHTRAQGTESLIFVLDPYVREPYGYDIKESKRLVEKSVVVELRLQKGAWPGQNAPYDLDDNFGIIGVCWQDGEGTSNMTLGNLKKYPSIIVAHDITDEGKEDIKAFRSYLEETNPEKLLEILRISVHRLRFLLETNHRVAGKEEDGDFTKLVEVLALAHEYLEETAPQSINERLPEFWFSYLRID